jgi:hypothetical protein
MRWAALLLLLAAAVVASADVVQVFTEDADTQQVPYEGEHSQSETYYLVDGEQDGTMHVVGLMQNFRLDTTGFQSINSLLTRPTSSFLDASWNSWVDQRMEMLDILQSMLNPVPRCSHMRGEDDGNVVSYMASSRFGPAMLTTYAQKFQEEEAEDFDYEDVYIPEGDFGMSYEDASLLNDLGVDADKAYEQTSQGDDSRLLLKGNKDQGFVELGLFSYPSTMQVIYQQSLDGDSESLQPKLTRSPPVTYSSFNSLATMEQQQEFAEDYSSWDSNQIAGMTLFIVLSIGCVSVWFSLLRNYCIMRRKFLAVAPTPQEPLLAPLMPEGAKAYYKDMEVAAGQAPEGTYYAPEGVQYVTVAVPLVGNSK